MRHSVVDEVSNAGFLAIVPADVVAALAFLLASDVVLVYDPAVPRVVRTVAAGPLLFFLPGYALVSALFPARDGLDDVERLALSFGVSLALLSLVGVGLAASAAGFSVVVLVYVLSAVVVSGLVVATVRRWRVSESRRFRVPYRDAVSQVVAPTSGARSRVDVVLNVALAVGVLAALVSVSYGLTVPHSTTAETNLLLLTEDSAGDLTASGYHSTLEATSETQLVFRVTNQGERRQFTVVAQLQRVREAGDATRVSERSEVGRWQSTLDAGDTWTNRHTVTPQMTGRDLRLVYFLYRGSAPATPSANTAYRRVHIWVDVPERGVASDDASNTGLESVVTAPSNLG